MRIIEDKLDAKKMIVIQEKKDSLKRKIILLEMVKMYLCLSLNYLLENLEENKTDELVALTNMAYSIMELSNNIEDSTFENEEEYKELITKMFNEISEVKNG